MRSLGSRDEEGLIRKGEWVIPSDWVANAYMNPIPEDEYEHLRDRKWPDIPVTELHSGGSREYWYREFDEMFDFDGREDLRYIGFFIFDDLRYYQYRKPLRQEAQGREDGR